MELPKQQGRMFECLKARSGEDVFVYELYEATFGRNVHRRGADGSLILGVTNRTMQQRLASTMRELRFKLEASATLIIPGELKNSYRLVETKK